MYTTFINESRWYTVSGICIFFIYLFPSPSPSLVSPPFRPFYVSFKLRVTQDCVFRSGVLYSVLYFTLSTRSMFPLLDTYVENLHVH